MVKVKRSGEVANYFFASVKDFKEWINPFKEKKYVLIGYGSRDGIKEEDQIRTSPVILYNPNEHFVVTASGTKYELREQNPFYSEFLDACKRRIPIITSWSLVDGKDGKIVIRGYIKGKYIEKQILSQIGNYIKDIDRKNYYVLWDNFEDSDHGHIFIFQNEIFWERNKEFKNYNGIKCKPTIY